MVRIKVIRRKKREGERTMGSDKENSLSASGDIVAFNKRNRHGVFGSREKK